QNPPELTRNWSCGQEAAFRMMAILFGTVCTLDSQAARPERLNRVAMLAWQTARHIAVNINYARSQGNNHAISEALWLITAGVVFGENFAPASRWLSDGLDIMCREIRRQVMDDGSYAQHSMNYHRLVMDDLPWTFGILRAGGIVVPDVMREKFEKLTCWIEEMADENTGRVPNYGPNDGAKVLPLSCCDYVDYRPTIQAAWYEVFGKSRYHAGCWNEKKLWLYGEESLDAPKSDVKKTAAFNAASGGYYVMRGRTSMAFTRCHTYTRRPNQNDMLHVDLWHEGKNILRDAGSFSYNAPEPWSGYFSSTAAHNTVTVNGENQMVRGPRHLWFRWTKSRLLEWFVSDDGSIGFFSGEHYGYSRFGATHRRSILRIGDGYVILDEIIGRRKEMKTELNWRLISDDWQAGFTGGGLRVVCPEATITVFAETGFDVSFDESGDAGPSGWESLYYGQKSPCPYIRVAGSSKAGTTKFVTIVSTGSTEMFPAMLDAMKTDAAVAMRHITEKFVDDVRHLTGMEMN
ncbi:MAG TPA: alginate lyase family protein, partial [Phycisphaerae bacterium]|nr:alginate lyase family protein [Phycisphaerae bacterium]